jgi:hypothetical protein
LRKFLDDINATDTKMNGRLNEEIILLKVAWAKYLERTLTSFIPLYKLCMSSNLLPYKGD